jgi:hypothetical protein
MARTYRRLFSFLTASLVLRATVAAIVGSGAFLASSDIIKPTRESEALRQPVVDHGTNNLTNTAQNDDISTITSFSEHRLQVDDGVRGAQFGFSVDVDGDTAVVSAPGDGDNRGSAYVYSRVGEEWILRQKLSSTDGTSDDHFGWDVAISGDTIVVGSYDLNEVDHGPR